MHAMYFLRTVDLHACIKTISKVVYLVNSHLVYTSIDNVAGSDLLYCNSDPH